MQVVLIVGDLRIKIKNGWIIKSCSKSCSLGTGAIFPHFSREQEADEEREARTTGKGANKSRMFCRPEKRQKIAPVLQDTNFVTVIYC